ncbi:MAG: hypothetical protein E7501_00250 [Ruminococcus sp.]|nr:hypothetical protein [Ruminococcus sp.]
MAVIRKYMGIVNTCPMILAPDQLNATAAVVGCVKMQGNGSTTEQLQKYVIYVGESQGMVLCNNGRVVEGVTEPGYYEIFASDAPQMFDKQQIFYLNAREIGEIRFGTQEPLRYKNAATGEEKLLRCFGKYALRITNPLQLCNGLFANGLERLDFSENSAAASRLNEEFLGALQRAADKLAEDGCNFSAIAEQDALLTKYVAAELDSAWGKQYGLSLTMVDVASADPDAAPSAPRMEQSATIPVDAPVPPAAAPVPTPAEAAPAPVPAPAEDEWVCTACGTANTMKFCTECGSARPVPVSEPAPAPIPAPVSAPIPEPQTIVEPEPIPAPIPAAEPAPVSEPEGWKCSCGAVNTTRFCSVCGMQPPARLSWKCPQCGAMTAGGVCTECGAKKP